MARNGDATKGEPLDWRVILQIAAVAAGFVAFLTLIGGALLRLRFDELGLPADRAVAELPESMLTGVGVHFLLGPSIAGAVAALFVLTIRPETWWPPVRRAVVGILAAAFVVSVLALLGASSVWLIIGGLAALVAAAWPGYSAVAKRDRDGLLLARGPTVAVLLLALLIAVVESYGLDVYPHLTILALLALMAVLVIEGTARRAGSRRPVALVVFASFLVIGAAITYARTANAPTMEPVAVQLKDPDETLAGFYVGESSDRILVAELRDTNSAFVSSDRVGTVVAVDRARVVRTLLRKPASIRTDADGRAQVQALAAEVNARVKPSEPPTVKAPTPAARARTFGPLLHLHPRESVAPTSADYFLDHGRLGWKHTGRCKDHVFDLDARRLGSGGYSHASGCDHRGPEYRSTDLTRPYAGNRAAGLSGREGFYIDLDDRRRRPAMKVRRDGEQAILDNAGVTAYWEEHDAGEGWRRITYWFFYPLSIPPGTHAVGDRFAHEGDWESMSVLLAPASGSRDGWTPQSVRFHAHYGHIDLPWRRVMKATDGRGRQTHPVGFVARGSHATYPAAGRYDQVLRSGDQRIIEVDDVAFSCPDCPVWVTWAGARDAAGEPWYGFGGAWGQVGGNGDATGPTGPSRYRVGRANPDPEESLKATGP